MHSRSCYLYLINRLMTLLSTIFEYYLMSSKGLTRERKGYLRRIKKKKELNNNLHKLGRVADQQSTSAYSLEGSFSLFWPL